MDETNIVAQADVTSPASEAVTEKTVETEKVEAPKPNREEELQRALGTANSRARRLERDLAEERVKWDTANKRLEDLAKRFQPQEKVPDPQEDPVGAITHETKTIKDKLSEWERREQQKQEQEAAQRAQQDIERHWAASAQSFAAKQPDFPQAYDHLFKSAMEEFVEAGYDEQDAGALTQGYWRDIVNRARRDGVNPAERMYNLAKRRGFKAQKTEEKIETIASGTKATSPLASASGKAPNRLTAELIAEMKQEDFDKLSDADFKRHFG